MRLTKMEKAAVAVLFASGEPIPVSRLAQVFDCDDAAAHWMMRRVMVILTKRRALCRCCGWMTNTKCPPGRNSRKQ